MDGLDPAFLSVFRALEPRERELPLPDDDFTDGSLVEQEPGEKDAA